MVGINNKDVSVRLKEVVQASGKKSLRAFALSINTDPSYFSKVCEGTRSLSETMLNEIVDAYTVNREWLLYGRGEKFGQISPQNTRITHKSSDTYITDRSTQLTGAQVTLQEHIDLLKQRAKELQADKERLFALLESNLGGLSKGQQVIYAFVRSLLQYDVVRASQGNKKKEVELLGSLDRLIEDNLKVDVIDDKAVSVRS